MTKPIVAIIGRPNVGKSTLFNRIVKAKTAIVDDTPGVTRDRNYAETDWAGKLFTLVDTGGFIPKTSDTIEIATREQSILAIDEADVLVFLVDVRTGITTEDLELAEIVKKRFKGGKVVLAANKSDNANFELEVGDFYKLGLGEPHPISASIGRRIGDFLDEIVLGFVKKENIDEAIGLKLAVIGKPNVGKSSFVNVLLGKNQQIVTEIPGTTRDAIDTSFKYYGKDFTLIDTAGLRKKTKITNSIEFYSTLRTSRAIERCDLAILLIDGSQELSVQDIRVFQEAYEHRKPMILVVNKWDLVEKDEKTMRNYSDYLDSKLPEFRHIPKIFTSTITKRRVLNVMELVEKVYGEFNKRISTSKLNEVMEQTIFHSPPPSKTGKLIKIKYVSQVKTAPPVFVFFANEPTLIEEPYRKFLERRIREEFSFTGVPLTIEFRKKSKD
ncbi:ribosome biogenesis GTPase Der [bacterium]|nr:ribosome biogenesis GTPase Der [bacterium]